MADSSDRDLRLACEDLRKIEKDLAFQVIESYEDRRMDDFADALIALRSLVRVVTQLCSD